MKYYIRLINPNENKISYLTHKNKIKFCKTTALKYAQEFIKNFPHYTFQLEKEFWIKYFLRLVRHVAKKDMIDKATI